MNITAESHKTGCPVVALRCVVFLSGYLQYSKAKYLYWSGESKVLVLQKWLILPMGYRFKIEATGP